MTSAAAVIALLCFSFLLTACGGSKSAKVKTPAPPPSIEPAGRDEVQAEVQGDDESPEPGEVSQIPPKRSRVNEDKREDADDAIRVPADAKAILVDTGLASWYGAPYHKRRSSNGEIYNMHALTAAHRTLPLGSIVRVTNVKTGRSAVVRITDRGPFIPGRILDLSQAAAKKVDVWAAGVAMVRMEVLRAPMPLNSGGRWTVQIGAFEKEHAANKLADHLSHRYQNARVLCFSSPVGDWWVRVRVQDDDRKRAEEVARNTHTAEGETFLVRLD